MKILILGATGRTGRHIVEEALKRGHRVTAIARDPGKLGEYKIEIVEGSPYDQETMDKAVVGCDAVINTLNVSRKSDSPWAPLRAPADLISRSAANALRAMEGTGTRRFVALSTIGAGRTWKTSPAILKFIVSVSNLKHAFRDHGRQEALLEASSVDYTICRAPMLSNEPNPGGVAVTQEGMRPQSNVLSRNSAAGFFIDIIENKKHLREAVTISNRRISPGKSADKGDG